MQLLMIAWDHTIFLALVRTSARILTSADSVIVIVKHSLLPWPKPQSGQMNPTMAMCIRL